MIKSIWIVALVMSLPAAWPPLLPAWAEIASGPSQAPAAGGTPTAGEMIPEVYEFRPMRVAYVQDEGKWDDSEAMLGDAFKSIYAALARENIQPAGVPLVEYLDSDDTTFSFKAMVPVQATSGASLGPTAELGDGPTGKALKFVHRGSFDDLEQVYNRIDDYLASQNLSMARVVEEYITDQTITAPDLLVTNIYVFTK